MLKKIHRGAKLAAKGQREVFFSISVGLAARAGIAPAMTGIDDHDRTSPGSRGTVDRFGGGGR